MLVNLRRQIWIVIVSCWLSPIDVSFAADAAETHIARGVELRRQGDDLTALEEFRKGYELAKSPRGAAQLGLCEQALGRWSEAEAHLREAVRASNDAWVKKNRETLRDSLEAVKERIGRLEFVGSPAGAEISIAGQLIGRLPIKDPIVVNNGSVDVEASAPGFEPMRRAVMIKGGEY